MMSRAAARDNFAFSDNEKSICSSLHRKKARRYDAHDIAHNLPRPGGHPGRGYLALDRAHEGLRARDLVDLEGKLALLVLKSAPMTLGSTQSARTFGTSGRTGPRAAWTSRGLVALVRVFWSASRASARQVGSPRPVDSSRNLAPSKE